MENKNSKNVIYGLHNGDGAIRYVGLTTRGIYRRLSEHKNTAASNPLTPVHKWMNKYGRDLIEITILQVCNDLEELKVWECIWIAQLRAEGHALLNLTDGGDGTQGYVYDERIRSKMSKIMHDRYESEDYRRGRSEKTKAAWLDPVKAENMLAGRRGQFSYKAKLRDDDIARILELRAGGVSYAKLGAIFGVSGSAISGLCNGYPWNHLTGFPLKAPRKTK